MSDQGVAAALDALESLLEGPPECISAEVVERWHAQFREAVASAERGPGWKEQLERAHRLSLSLDRVLGLFLEQRDALRKELDAQGKGIRALKAYQPR